jgi:O-antigen/teichoic acid export membrane protein
MDIAIIGLFLTQAHVGAYEVAWRVTSVSILFSQAISMTIFPQVSEWSANGSNERIEDLIATVMTPSLFFVIPVFFGSILLSQDILALVFGQDYAIASVVLIVLMSDKIFQAIQLVVGRSLQAIDKPDLAARAVIISILSNAVLNIVLVVEFGIIGAAVATLVSSVLNDALHLIYLQKFIRVQFPYKEILECISASLVMTGAIFVVKSIYGIGDILQLVIIIVSGGMIYCLTALLLPNLRSKAIVIANQYIAPRISYK